MPTPLFDLTGKVALVTGGNKGLGKAMARGLAEAGADVVIASRHGDELKAALDEILAGTGREGNFFVADVSDRDDVKKLARSRLGKMGRVDILVNNAGMNAPQAIDAGHRRDVGPGGGGEPHLGHGPDPRAGPADEGAAAGAG